MELHQLSGMGHGTPLGRDLAEGCGRAGPYLLEVGVSSSLEIARAWGLTVRRPGQTAKPRPHASAEALDGPAWTRPAANAATSPPPLRAVASGIGDVITDALRSAGLLR